MSFFFFTSSPSPFSSFLLILLLTSFFASFLLSNFIPTDVLDGVRSHHEDVGVTGVKGEDEGDVRAEEEQFHFGGDDHAADTAATCASALPTNPLPLEALPTTSSTQGPLELTNPSSELTFLGKITG